MIADDVTRAVRLAPETLTAAAHLDWQKPAGGLEWSCWETVEHMSDDLFVYAAQLGPANPSTSTHVPFGWQRRRTGGPPLTIFVDSAEGPSGLLQVFETCGAMLAAMIDTAAPDRLSFHAYGPSDASGFAPVGLDLTWVPPADLCVGALRRLFPSSPSGGEPWLTLLWATGRADLRGLPGRTSWTWDGAPRP